MPSGVLLLMFEGKQEGYKSYACPKERDDILDYWRKSYGPVFKRCEVINKENPDMRVERKNKRVNNKPDYGSLNNFGGKIYPGQKTKVL